jgi:hypothetical protein
MDVNCPPEARTLMLAERFHVPPWEVENAPADRVLFWIQVMGIEGQVSADREGMAPDEILEMDEYDEDD